MRGWQSSSSPCRYRRAAAWRSSSPAARPGGRPTVPVRRGGGGARRQPGGAASDWRPAFAGGSVSFMTTLVAVLVAVTVIVLVRLPPAVTGSGLATLAIASRSSGGHG